VPAPEIHKNQRCLAPQEVGVEGSFALSVSEHESNPSEEIAALSEGHLSFWELDRASDGNDKQMTAGNAGSLLKTIPAMTDAELELGGPRGSGLTKARRPAPLTELGIYPSTE
jgi:hypothetical protein